MTLGALFGACGADRPSCDVVFERAALTNGTRHAEYLALDRSEEAAIVAVQLRFSESPFHEMCSGVLVADRVVLTARHCLHGLEPDAVEVVFEGGEVGSRVVVDASLAAAHPTLDVIALTLSNGWNASIEVAPLPLAESLPTGLGPSSLVQIGGFGEDADGVVGRRAFLVEAVEEVEPDMLVVSAERLGGACFGDSGGPLLVRADDGSVRTLGLLAFGAVSCFGLDHYTRVDELGSWAAEAGLDLDISERASGADERLGTAGRCFDERAVWFEEGILRATVCSGDQACGWSRESRGYRCVVPAEDDCRGIDELGMCWGGYAVTCASGQLEENACSTCGFECRRSPQTGAAICL
jgi:hypothetical protein